MGLNELLDKIGEKSTAEIAQVKKQALKQAKEIKGSGGEEAKKIKEEGKEKSSQKAQSLQEKMVQHAHLETSKEVLKEKMDGLEAVFSAALESLGNLPEKEFLPWVENLVLQSIEEGKAEIIVREKDRSKISADFLKEMNRKLGGRSELKFSSQVRDIEGGFILKQGRKEINCSFEALLEEKRDALKLKLNELVFK